MTSQTEQVGSHQPFHEKSKYFGSTAWNVIKFVFLVCPVWDYENIL